MTRAMKDSGIEWIGNIPESWKIERLQWHLYELNIKNNPIRTENVLSLTNKLGVIPYEEKGNQGNKSKENRSEYKLAFKDTIVANSMNILIGSVGYSKYYGCVSPVYYVFKELDENNLSFINYIMQTREFQKELRKYANGILEIRLRVSVDDILKRKIAVPSVNEQKKIADYLDKKCGEIDAITAQIQEQITTLEEYKKSIISEAVTKGLTPNAPMKDSGIEWIGKIPANWEITKVKYISNTISKGNGITKEDVVTDGDIQCIRYGEIYSKYNNSFVLTHSMTNLNKISSPRYIKKGDILFAGTGELIEEIGKNIVYLGDEVCLAGGDIIILRHNQNCGYLNYTLNSHYAQLQKSIGKAKLKVVHISSSDIGNIFVALPSLIEQQEIADYLDVRCTQIEEAIADKKKQIETLEEYKKTLIYEYVTGKKEVANVL